MISPWLLVAVAVCCVSPLWAQRATGVWSGAPQSPAQTTRPSIQSPITVSTTGQAEAVPNAVVLRFSLMAYGETVTAARQEVKKVGEAVMEAFGKLGVSRQRVVLQHYEVLPLQTRPVSSSEGDSARTAPFVFQVVEGYTLQMPLNPNQFDTLARLIDTLVEKGARPGIEERGLGEGYYGSSSSRLIEFVVTDLDRLVRKATADAVARARQMAEQLAQQLGHKQVRLQSVRVDSVSYQQPCAFGGVQIDPTRERLSFPAWRPVQVTVYITAQFGVAGARGR